ncbi:TIGR04282 family arsenosugar biosynthesis glycosyltransferase [bacterium]|nr:TIGR04282 family arsenosugar biosynthesis glycosyltransferase [bacterium]
MTPALGVFMREPVAGKVKTRMARKIGRTRACAVYVECVRRTLRTASRSGLPVRIFYTPAGSAERIRDRFQISFDMTAQKGRSLGARMRRAFEVLLKKYTAAILIGSDSPTLPVRFIGRAGRMLRTNDLVLGPSEDGGYYLIGLTRRAYRRSAHVLFSRIQWGGPRVFRDTISRAQRARLRVEMLPLWFDVDTPEDARRAGI